MKQTFYSATSQRKQKRQYPFSGMSTEQVSPQPSNPVTQREWFDAYQRQQDEARQMQEREFELDRQKTQVEIDRLRAEISGYEAERRMKEEEYGIRKPGLEAEVKAKLPYGVNPARAQEQARRQGMTWEQKQALGAMPAPWLDPYGRGAWKPTPGEQQEYLKGVEASNAGELGRQASYQEYQRALRLRQDAEEKAKILARRGPAGRSPYGTAPGERPVIGRFSVEGAQPGEFADMPGTIPLGKGTEYGVVGPRSLTVEEEMMRDKPEAYLKFRSEVEKGKQRAAEGEQKQKQFDARMENERKRLEQSADRNKISKDRLAVYRQGLAFSQNIRKDQQRLNWMKAQLGVTELEIKTVTDNFLTGSPQIKEEALAKLAEWDKAMREAGQSQGSLEGTAPAGGDTTPEGPSDAMKDARKQVEDAGAWLDGQLSPTSPSSQGAAATGDAWLDNHIVEVRKAQQSGQDEFEIRKAVYASQSLFQKQYKDGWQEKFRLLKEAAGLPTGKTRQRPKELPYIPQEQLKAATSNIPLPYKNLLVSITRDPSVFVENLNRDYEQVNRSIPGAIGAGMKDNPIFEVFQRIHDNPDAYSGTLGTMALSAELGTALIPQKWMQDEGAKILGSFWNALKTLPNFQQKFFERPISTLLEVLPLAAIVPAARGVGRLTRTLKAMPSEIEGVFAMPRTGSVPGARFLPPTYEESLLKPASTLIPETNEATLARLMVQGKRSTPILDFMRKTNAEPTRTANLIKAWLNER